MLNVRVLTITIHYAAAAYWTKSTKWDRVMPEDV